MDREEWDIKNEGTDGLAKIVIGKRGVAYSITGASPGECTIDTNLECSITYSEWDRSC